MKVAIVGGNLLGCATAHYLRRVLDEQRDAPDSNRTDDDEIIIFEKESALGGGKFATARVGAVEVETGTACGIDSAACPLLSSALNDVDVVPPRAPQISWAFFDWDADQTLLASKPLRFLPRLARSISFHLLFHALCAVAMSKYVKLWRAGLRPYHLFLMRNDVFATGIFTGFVLLSICGFGIVPFRWLAALWNRVAQTIIVNIGAKFNYGSSLDMAATVVKQMKDHLRVIDEQRSCEGAITVGHLLSRCGMAKYGKVGAAECLEKFFVQDKFREDLVAPDLTYTYAESRFRPSHVANALATMLEMLTRLKLPTGIRWKARELSLNQVKTLCPKLAGAARASLQVCVNVTGVVQDGKDKYGLCVETAHGPSMRTGFDAVIIAATVDASNFDMDGVVEKVRFELAQNAEATKQRPASALYEEVAAGSVLRKQNTSQYMSLVVGEVNSAYFRRRSAKSMPVETNVLNALDCSQIVRVGEHVWRVISANKLDADSELISKLFLTTEKVVSWERPQRRYIASPLRDINGSDVPSFILGKRLIYAAAIDRVANHVEVDCMAARNAASLFKPGNVTWK